MFVLIFFKEEKKNLILVTIILWEKIHCWTGLLSWTTSRALLINLKTLQTFLPYLENLTLPAFIFFILITQQETTGKMILLQRKILNIFPGFIEASSAGKILSSYCSRYTYEYIPHRDLWLSRLYFNISSSNKKQCLTIDTRDVNNL